ncbi:MAG: tetratricopeptide repeat protein [Bacteroidia bacterium]
MKHTPPIIPPPAPSGGGKNKGKKIGKQLKSRPQKNDRLILFVVFAFAFLLYANTLNHGYVLDDDVVYLKNKDVQAGFSGIGSILHHSFIYGFTGHNDQSYRPVVSIVFAIEKQFFGNNPHTGHFINVLLFALSCVLLFWLLKRLFNAIISPLSSWRGVRGEVIPFIITLLFASHPIHTEAVANIKGRDDILNFIFFVLSLSFVLRHIDDGGKKYFILSVLFFFLALMCKEMAVTFLAIIPLTVFFFRDVPIKKIATGIIPFAAAFGIYMLIRSSVLETVTFAEKMKVMNNALASATNEPDRIATAILILGKYILLLFFPHPLSWDYSFNEIPVVSFLDIKVILTLVVFITLGFYAMISLIKLVKQPEARSEKPETAVFIFCILFFFISMSVVSNIFIMIGSTLGERFLFTPSIAFCMAVPFLLHRFGKNILIGAAAVIVLLFSFKTFSRNQDWKDNFSLFAAGVDATPNSSRAESALGSSYREMGEKEADPNKRTGFFQKAIVYYKKAIEILPDNTEALYNAGVCYYGMGDAENARKVYEQALKVSPEYTSAANNLGVIYFERKEYEPAKKYFLQAIKYDANNVDALGNLGAIYHNLGDLKTAVSYYEKALQLNPNNQNIQSNWQKAKANLNSSQQNPPLPK